MKAKKSVYVVPATSSSVVSMQFPNDMLISQVEDKFKEQFARMFNTPAFDFKKVGASESLNWYIGIACEYQESVRAELVVPEVYAKAWLALKNNGEDKYCLVVVPTNRSTYFVIGKGEPLLVNEFDFNLDSISNTLIAKSINIAQEDFRRITFPAAEIEKTLIIGDVATEKLEAFKYPEVIQVNPEDYAGSLSVNSKFAFKNKFNWNKFVLSLPVVGREVVSLAITFLLFFSWVFPVRSAMMYAINLFNDNNAKLQANIQEIQESKSKIQEVIDNIRKQQELVQQWQSAAKSVKRIDFVELLKTILKNPNVSYIQMSDNNISITLSANSPTEVDSYLKMLIDSGFFTGFSAPERKKGTSTYMLKGELR